MAGKARELTAAQEAAVQRVAALVEGKAQSIPEVEAEVAALRAERMGRIDRAIEDAVAEAALLGVPKTSIARKGYGHIGPSEVYRVLRAVAEREEGAAGPALFATRTAPTGERIEGFTLRDDDEVVVSYTGWQTASKAPDYPRVLRGVLVRDDSKPNGWDVIEDETDDYDARTGALVPGHLRWEIDRVPLAGETLFSDIVSKWWSLQAQEASA